MERNVTVAAEASLQIESGWILVTGGASGIGLATATLLIRRGRKVVIMDRDATAGRAALEVLGNDCIFFEADVSSFGAINAAIAKGQETFGSLTGAFNNAGVARTGKSLVDLDDSDWDRVHDINLRAVFSCMRSEIRAMKDGGGAIVNMASVAGMLGAVSAAEYVSSQHGIVGLTRAASTEFPATGVRVNAVLPGFIVTPMTETLMRRPEFAARSEEILKRHSVGRLGQPEDVAEAVFWLMSDRASFINGITLPVDGGYLVR